MSAITSEEPTGCVPGELPDGLLQKIEMVYKANGDHDKDNDSSNISSNRKGTSNTNDTSNDNNRINGNTGNNGVGT